MAGVTDTIDYEPKKPKPRPKQEEQKSAADDLLASVKEFYQDALDRNMRRLPRVTLATAFYRGLQWGDSTIYGFEPDLQDPSERREIYNYVRAIVNSAVAEYLRNLPEPQLIASHDDQEAMARAIAATLLAKSFMRNGVLAWDTLYRGVLAAVMHGGAWFKVFWDPSAGRQVGTDEFGFPLFEGQIAVQHVDCIDALPDANARSERTIRRMFHQKLLPVDELLDMWQVDFFGEDTTGRWDKSNPVGGQAQRDFIESGSTYGTENRGGRAAGEALGLAVECWERPSKQFPQGRFLVFSGNMLLEYQEALPIEWPWVMIYGPNVVEASLYPDGAVLDLVSLQRTMNLNVTKQAEWMDRILNPPLMEPRGAELDIDEWSDIPGSTIVKYNQGYPPKWLDTPPIPPSTFSLFEQVLKAMKDVSTYSDVSRGELPPGAGSGRAIAYLTQIETGVHAPTVQYFKETITRVLSLSVMVARDRYPDGRLINMVGENQQWTVKRFRKDDFDFEATLIVEAYSGTPNSRALRYDETTEAANNGLLDDTPRARRARAILGWDFDGRATFDADEPDKARAMQENVQFLQDPLGAHLEALPADNHDVHLDKHRLVLISMKFLALPPWAQQSFLFHVEQHEQMHGAGAQSFANQQQMIQGGSTPQQGGAPPPSAPGVESPLAGGHSIGEGGPAGVPMERDNARIQAMQQPQPSGQPQNGAMPQ